MNKKASFLCCVLVLSGLSACSTGKRQRTSSSKSEDEVVISVSSVEDLAQLNGSTKAFVLLNDIDLKGSSSFTPIEKFSGTFDGAGHSIRNFSLTMREGENFGFFKENTGLIKSVRMENVQITVSGDAHNVGALVGLNGGQLDECYASGTINGARTDSIGGIAGKTTNNAITNCVNEAQIDGQDGVGGIVGTITHNRAASSFKDNQNKGKISGKNKVGGILGQYTTYSSSNLDYGKIGLSYLNNSGEIVGTGSNVGGIAGAVHGTERTDTAAYYQIGFNVTDFTNTGSVTGCDNVSGCIGYASMLLSFKHSSNEGTIVGKEYVGGLIGHGDSSTNNEDLTCKGKVKGTSYVGGLAGTTGSIISCTSDCQIDVDGTSVKYVGGLAGSSGYVQKSTNNSGLVFDTDGTYQYIGGISGEMIIPSGGECIDNTNNGNVVLRQLNAKYVGGIAGYIQAKINSSMTYNKNAGTLAGKEYVGGIAGYIQAISGGSSNSGYAEINDNENSGNISVGNNYAGGIFGYAGGQKLSSGVVMPDYYVKLHIRYNVNKGAIDYGSEIPESDIEDWANKDYGASIVGYANYYVNDDTPSNWATNRNEGSVHSHISNKDIEVIHN